MSGYAVKLYGSRSVKVPTSQDEFDTFCPCDFNCDFEEMVFASGSTDEHKKDFTEVLFSKVGTSDTVQIKLYRYGQFVANLNDNTYGTFYNGFTPQPNYVGYLINWTLVNAAFGGGRYQVKAEMNILGSSFTLESRYFRLGAWDELSAMNTVKIESYQNGNIIGSEFDYTDLNWYQSIRLPGTFGKNNPSIERDNFLNTSYEVIQNRDVVVNEYELRINGITEEILNRITNNDILGNQIYVTDYNLLSTKIYRKKAVYVDSISEVSYLANNFVNVTLLCRDRNQDIIKRNF